MNHTYKIHSIDNFQSHTLLTLAPVNEPMRFLPGQYATIRSYQGLNSTPARCFSVVSSPDEATLQMAFRRSGAFTSLLSTLLIGDKVKVQGPFGEFTITDRRQPAIFLAGGIGVTPFISMMRHAQRQETGQTIRLLSSNRSIDQTPFFEEIRTISSRAPSISAEFYTEVGDVGTIAGRIGVDQLKAIDDRYPDAEYYMCGPEYFTEAMSKYLNSLDIETWRQHTESFSQMHISNISGGIIKNTIIASVIGLAGLVGTITTVDLFQHAGKKSVSSTPGGNSTATRPTSPSAVSSTSDNQVAPSYTSSYPTDNSSTQTYYQPSTTSYASPSSSAS